MTTEEFYRLTGFPFQLNRSSGEDLKNLTEAYPHFHAAWILYLKYLKDAGDPTFDQVLQNAAPLLPDRKQLYKILHSKADETSLNYALEHSPVTSSEPGGNTLIRTDTDLIEKFLTSRAENVKSDKPLAARHQAEPDDNIIARSLAEDDEMVTETLAMIYFNQKKYDKAADAFRKLSLKYPEKSIYFASRIEEIDKLRII